MTAIIPLTQDYTNANNPNLIMKLDDTDLNNIYVGTAVPGSLSSEAKWKIKKVSSVTGGLNVKLVDLGNFNQIWDNRVSLTYL